MWSVRGRFAPSPTGPLHLGNLRTALVSWLSVRSQSGEWIVRMEDLDRTTSSPVHEAAQLAELRALGLEPDGPVVRQSERFDRHREALGELAAGGHVYECFCTRREIREAVAAPHGDAAGDGYPGTCAQLTARQMAQRRRSGRTPALRLRAGGRIVRYGDRLAGELTAPADDVVLLRNDGVPAYNLAVVVDDAAQAVTEVVRGDDLLAVTPAQALLHDLLDLPRPRYAHVPLVLAPDGSRLAKRHGAVTIEQLAERGVDAVTVRSWLATSLGLCGRDDRPPLDELVAAFDWERLPRSPWQLTPADLSPPPPTK